MTTTNNLKDDLEDVSEHVLGELSTAERLRLFVRAAADNRDDRIKQLGETAPRHTYTATDLEYTDATTNLFVLSLLATQQLQQTYQAIVQHEAARDQQVALMLLNEALARLSRDEFAVDEYGGVDAPEHGAADYDYALKRSPDIACLATKYRRVWADLPFELLLREDDRMIKYFPDLAAGGLIGYPSDLSSSAFDDLKRDRVPSDVYLSELRLLHAVVDFYTHFHGWRLFAEDYLDVSLDELLAVTPSDEEYDVRTVGGVLEIDEQVCRNILSLKEDYLKAYPTLIEEWADDDEEIDPDLDARAHEYADGLAEGSDLPL